MSQVRTITISSDLYDGQVCFATFLDSQGNTTNLGQQIISFSFQISSAGSGTCFVYLPLYDNTFVINITSDPCPTPTATMTPTPSPTPDSNLLLQENLFLIEQEDNFGIIIE